MFERGKEQAFDRITALAAMLFDVPMAGLAVADPGCEWFKSSLGPTVSGLSGTPLSSVAVSHAVESGAPYTHFTAAAPVVGSNGQQVAVLYVADTRPRVVSDLQLLHLCDLAAIVSAELALRAKNRELVVARDRLAELATIDELTQVPNKRAFNQRLTQFAAEAERGRRFAVVMVDLDHFKRINDTLGHLEGDRTLQRVAAALSRAVRKTDFVARFGGEEFCVLLADVDASAALALAERLRAAVAAVEGPTPITASFGVCVCAAPDRARPEGLLESADQAMYRAKRGGRNRVAMARRTMPSPRTSAPKRPHVAA